MSSLATSAQAKSPSSANVSESKPPESKPSGLPTPSQTPVAKGLVTGGPLSDFVKEVAGPLHLGNPQTAAAMVASYLEFKDNFGAPLKIKNDDQAFTILTAFLQFLLDAQRYADAARILWKPNIFSAEPRSVRMIWDALFQNSQVMVPGSSSMGKSYGIGVWMMLDWLRDPQYTNIQVVGPSENHLERNLFSHLVKLHRASSIPIPGEIRQLEISIDSKNKDSGIFGVVVPVGKKAAGRLQGVKIVQRPVLHPQFGPLSRLRVVLEEAENIPVGIWEDVTNIVSNINGIDRFKVVAPFNPKDPNGPCAIRCEPVDGWESVNCEDSEEWTSKRGWKVVRLEPYKSENVVSGQELFFGLQTKQGMEISIRNSGGVGTAGYYTFVRGWYPPQGVDLAVIPQHLMLELVGTYDFSETPAPTAALDVALEGGDNAIILLGKGGRSTGWRKAPGADGKPGPFLPFVDAFGQPASREVLQIEQIFTVPKGNTLELVAHATRICKGASVRGEHFGEDRTGNGAGVHDILVSSFNSAVKGINPSTSPTERKILQEDTILPCDEYPYLLSELWFALRKYIEFGFVKIAPGVPTDPLNSELTGRRFLLGGKKIKVESKKEYKSRGNKSPDRADALTMLVHVMRLNSGGPPSVTQGQAHEENDASSYAPRVGITDRRDYL